MYALLNTHIPHALNFCEYNRMVKLNTRKNSGYPSNTGTSSMLWNVKIKYSKISTSQNGEIKMQQQYNILQ